jgi:5-methylcytosine-specific restriction endonuclease McrA
VKRSKPMRRGKPLRSRSKKMEARYAGATGRRALVARLLKERPLCQALRAFTIAAAACDPLIDEARRRCEVRSRDVHELLARSAGGDILDPANIVVLCRSCHRWVHAHPEMAKELGLRRSRYARGAA